MGEDASHTGEKTHTVVAGRGSPLRGCSDDRVKMVESETGTSCDDCGSLQRDEENTLGGILLELMRVLDGKRWMFTNTGRQQRGARDRG